MFYLSTGNALSESYRASRGSFYNYLFLVFTSYALDCVSPLVSWWGSLALGFIEDAMSAFDRNHFSSWQCWGAEGNANRRACRGRRLETKRTSNEAVTAIRHRMNALETREAVCWNTVIIFLSAKPEHPQNPQSRHKPTSNRTITDNISVTLSNFDSVHYQSGVDLVGVTRRPLLWWFQNESKSKWKALIMILMAIHNYVLLISCRL